MAPRHHRVDLAHDGGVRPHDRRDEPAARHAGAARGARGRARTRARRARHPRHPRPLADGDHGQVRARGPAGGCRPGTGEGRDRRGRDPGARRARRCAGDGGGRAQRDRQRRARGGALGPRGGGHPRGAALVDRHRAARASRARRMGGSRGRDERAAPFLGIRLPRHARAARGVEIADDGVGPTESSAGVERAARAARARRERRAAG